MKRNQIMKKCTFQMCVLTPICVKQFYIFKKLNYKHMKYLRIASFQTEFTLEDCELHFLNRDSPVVIWPLLVFLCYQQKDLIEFNLHTQTGFKKDFVYFLTGLGASKI